MFRIFIYVFITLSILSCSTALKVEPVPSEFRQITLKYFVENHGTDKRRLDKIIALELKSYGYDVSSGYKSERPAEFDILVIYEDRWQWDMSNYLIHMRIDLRSPETNVLLGTGSSYQSSLSRKGKNLIIKDIISGMFSN